MCSTWLCIVHCTDTFKVIIAIVSGRYNALSFYYFYLPQSLKNSMPKILKSGQRIEKNFQDALQVKKCM